MRRHRFAFVLACLVCALGVSGAAFVARADAPGLLVGLGRVELSGGGDAGPLRPVEGFEAAWAAVPQVPVYESPGAAVPFATLRNPTWEGVSLAFGVLDHTGEWAQVRVPTRPNGTTGWVRTGDVMFTPAPNRIVVEVGARRLTVFEGDGDRVLLQEPVAVGSARTPTPVGDFYVDIVNPLANANGVYGWGQLSVAGFSEVLKRFGGGIGQIAIHGTNRPDLVGQAVSNGCIRMRNDAIERLAALAPVGTPVTIVP